MRQNAEEVRAARSDVAQVVDENGAAGAARPARAAERHGNRGVNRDTTCDRKAAVAAAATDRLRDDARRIQALCNQGALRRHTAPAPALIARAAAASGADRDAENRVGAEGDRKTAVAAAAADRLADDRG